MYRRPEAGVLAERLGREASLRKEERLPALRRLLPPGGHPVLGAALEEGVDATIQRGMHLTGGRGQDPIEAVVVGEAVCERRRRGPRQRNDEEGLRRPEPSDDRLVVAGAVLLRRGWRPCARSPAEVLGELLSQRRDVSAGNADWGEDTIGESEPL